MRIFYPEKKNQNDEKRLNDTNWSGINITSTNYKKKMKNFK